MTDDIEYPKRGYDTEDVSALREQGSRKPRRRRWGLIALLALVVLPAALFALWTWIALSFSYSRGERVGFAIKLSEKGWLCKTWEGELQMIAIPGAAPETFRYSVRDDSLARALQALEGARVALTYEQHKGVPTSCFGETEYFVTGARRVDR
jgi:hypothetical protein